MNSKATRCVSTTLGTVGKRLKNYYQKSVSRPRNTEKLNTEILRTTQGEPVKVVV